MPGNLLLGARYLESTVIAEFAQELLDSCYQTWKNSPTGLSPESWNWIDESPAGNTSSTQYSATQVSTFKQLGFIPNDLRYMLRPGSVHKSNLNI